MSSATRYQPGAVRKLIDGLASKLNSGPERDTAAQTIQRISRLGMSPRQQALNRLWAWYRCEQYAARRVDWNGREIVDPIEHEAIASAGFIPPGFYDAGATYPVKFRKPTAPYALVKVIVDRFTELLFSEKHHPRVQVLADSESEDYLAALVETGRLWPQMIQARTFGGAMGSVAIGFQFVEGKLAFEVHDPRWLKPTFKSHGDLTLKSVEKRYLYPVDELDPATGTYVTNWYWYRRVIDDEMDVLFPPTPVGDGAEPEWDLVNAQLVEHGLGFCPMVWIQNLPVQDDADGDSDALGIYELIEAIDALVAQAHKGVLANCDPTLVISTSAQMSEIKKGSDNAIKIPDGSASYLEIAGSGPDAAMKQAEELRRLALEVAQVVLEHPDVSQRTATEIERVYSSMLAKADVLREQYGEKGIKPLMVMVIKAVRKVGAQARVNEEGKIERQAVFVPPRLVRNEAGELEPQERKLGAVAEHMLEVTWPRYFETILSDVELATRSAIAAKTGGLIDQEHAVKFVAEHFRVEDPHGMMKKIEEERTQREGDLAQQALGMLQTPGVPGGEEM